MPQLATQELLNLDCAPYYFWECVLAYWLWRLIPGSLIAFGTMGNILNLVVLSRQNMRRYSATVYLMFLAVSDLMFLWTLAFRETVYATSGINLANVSAFFCKFLFMMGLASGMSSAWLLVMLTIERVLMTRFPVYTWNRLTPKVAIIVCSVTEVIVCGCNSHIIFGFTYYVAEDFISSVNVTNEEVLFNYGIQCQYASDSYYEFFLVYWNSVVVPFYNIIPLVIITLGNVSIAATIFLRQKRRMKVHATSSDTASKSGITQATRIKATLQPSNANDTDRQPSTTETMATETAESRETIQHRNNNKSVTRILLATCLFFLVASVPYTIYYAIKPLIMEVSYKTVARIQLLQTILHCLFYSNFSINFFLYFISGTLFKQEWVRLKADIKSKLICRQIN